MLNVSFLSKLGKLVLLYPFIRFNSTHESFWWQALSSESWVCSLRFQSSHSIIDIQLLSVYSWGKTCGCNLWIHNWLRTASVRLHDCFLLFLRFKTSSCGDLPKITFSLDDPFIYTFQTAEYPFFFIRKRLSWATTCSLVFHFLSQSCDRALE